MPSGCAVPTPDTGGSEFVRPLPAVVAGSCRGVPSAPLPVVGSTVKMWITSPWSPWVGPSTGELPLGVPLTYAWWPSGANATPP